MQAYHTTRLTIARNGLEREVDVLLTRDTDQWECHKERGRDVATRAWVDLTWLEVERAVERAELAGITDEPEPREDWR